MKKIISIFAVIAMICAFSTTAFAASPIKSVTDGSNSDSHDVMAMYTGSASTPAVYSVDVQWGDMEFTYNVDGTKEWDASNHSYTDKSTASWTASGNTVSVTNHSNVDVTADFSFIKATGYNDITGAFNKETTVLNAGVENDYNNASKTTAALTISGTLDSSIKTLTKVGTVTVTIR